MAESTLSKGYPEIAKAIGVFLGYGADYTAWTDAVADQIDGILLSGVQQFYFPPPLPGQSKAHEWSFLRPVTTLATVADTYQYDMPDNFGSIMGDFSYSSTDNGPRTIRITSESKIRDLRQRAAVPTGFPTLAAIRPVTTDGATGQRQEVIFYPTPDAAYTLSYRYAVLADKISRLTAPYPFGGMQHSETVLQSCLQIAEERGDDEAGIHKQKFFERLAASVSLDKSQDPDFYGYNADRSDYPRDFIWRNQGVTYNGVLY